MALRPEQFRTAQLGHFQDAADLLLAARREVLRHPNCEESKLSIQMNHLKFENGMIVIETVIELTAVRAHERRR